jgi:DNA-binding LytR/AlgR family response regulator
MTCLIIDDDEIALKTIRHCVERTDFLTLDSACQSVMEAIPILKSRKIDLILLDIEMPNLTGMDFMKSFPTQSQIIIISGKKDYAAESYDYNVTDYIVKAVMKVKEIDQSLLSSETKDGNLFLKKDSRLIKIHSEDIIWVEAMADYATIHCKNGERHTICSTMKSVEGKLNQTEFARIHRSYIIRLDQIKEIEENSVSIGGQVLPVSRGYKDLFMSRLNLL